MVEDLMLLIEKTLLQGIILLLIGIFFLKEREKIVSGLKKSHETFWNDIVRWRSEFGRPADLFARVLVFVLGASFVFGGIVLLVRFVVSLN